MRHLLLVSCVLAACGSREDFHAAVKTEVSAEPDVVAESSDVPEVTNAAGRAYLAKLVTTGDTACKCNSEECGKSVMESWAMGMMVPGSSDYTLSAKDRAREEQLLQRLMSCAAVSDPAKRADVVRIRAEAKAARAKVLAQLDNPYEGEADATRIAIRALRRDVRELCACTSTACIDKLQSRFAEPPVVTTKREVDLVSELLAGAMTCGTHTVVNDSFAAVK